MSYVKRVRYNAYALLLLNRLSRLESCHKASQYARSILDPGYKYDESWLSPGYKEGFLAYFICRTDLGYVSPGIAHVGCLYPQWFEIHHVVKAPGRATIAKFWALIKSIHRSICRPAAIPILQCVWMYDQKPMPYSMYRAHSA